MCGTGSNSCRKQTAPIRPVLFANCDVHPHTEQSHGELIHVGCGDSHIRGSWHLRISKHFLTSSEVPAPCLDLAAALVESNPKGSSWDRGCWFRCPVAQQSGLVYGKQMGFELFKMRITFSVSLSRSSGVKISAEKSLVLPVADQSGVQTSQVMLVQTKDTVTALQHLQGTCCAHKALPYFCALRRLKI